MKENVIMASGTVRLLQITDLHCYADDDARLSWAVDLPVYPNRALRAVLAHLTEMAHDYHALLWTGDLAQEETAPTYQRLNALAQSFPLPIYALPGNHDLPELMRTHLQGRVQLPKYITLDNWHLLLLDTSCASQPHGHLDDARLDELQSLLASIPPQQFVAIFMHHHPVNIDSAWQDSTGLRQKNRFWALLGDYPQVKAVFHGHIHQEFTGEHPYPRSRKVLVYGTPATCVQIKPRQKKLVLDHARPAWRNIILRPDGTIETSVNYLPSQVLQQFLPSAH
ncbi:MAG: metallophosphoesterase [Proteobacteria bacterium]|nr:metallophosphoesterase [Pseudomonadota bacterium]